MEGNRQQTLFRFDLTGEEHTVADVEKRRRLLLAVAVEPDSPLLGNNEKPFITGVGDGDGVDDAFVDDIEHQAPGFGAWDVSEENQRQSERRGSRDELQKAGWALTMQHG